MFGQRGRVNQDIVDIRGNENVKEVMERVVHILLKCARSVLNAEWHYEIFEKSPSSPKGSVLLIAFAYANSIESSYNVEFREVSCFC